jgi:cysteinyl-tRNA synthetase
MHNGYITIDNEKMSKSKGNFFTVRDILKDYDGEVIRFFLLSGHYRSPINFSQELMEQAKNSLARMQNAKNNLKHLIENGSGSMTPEEAAGYEAMKKYQDKFIAAMDDDLNTADAISVVFELIKDINTLTRDGASKEFAKKCLSQLDELTGVLGLLRKKRRKETPSTRRFRSGGRAAGGKKGKGFCSGR